MEKPWPNCSNKLNCDEELFSFGVSSVRRADKKNKDDYNIQYYQEEDARKLLSALQGPRYGFLLLIENR